MECPFCGEIIEDWTIYQDHWEDGDTFEMECPFCGQNIIVMVHIAPEYEGSKGVAKADAKNRKPV